jgi:hypothetical protein
MDKGIRAYADRKFIELLPQRGELGNTLFRKTVIADIMEQFGTTLASAATHYNHAFKEARKTVPQMIEGLGRPEDKKGGRKKKVAAVEPTTETPAAEPTLAEAALAEAAAEQAQAEPTEPAAEQPVEQPQTYTVIRVKDGAVVRAGLNRFDAEELVSRAAAQKKAKLAIA